MSKLEKWDQKVLALGNGVQWLSLVQYRTEGKGTQKKVFEVGGR